MRGECPVHWTSEVTEFPERSRLLVGDHGRRRPRGQPRLADLLLRTAAASSRSTRSSRSSSRGRCSSAWTRPSTTGSRRSSRRGFTPKRIAAHEDAIREIVDRRARPPRGPRDLRPRHRRRPARRLARDRQLHGHPARRTTRPGRELMNSALGAGDPDLSPGRRRERRSRRTIPRDLRALPAR